MADWESLVPLRDLSICLRSHLRHLPNERNHVPDRCIIECLAPRGHGAHLDAVFDYPECPPTVAEISLRKVRRVRIETWANLRLHNPRCQVTAGAKRRIAFRTGCDPLRVLRIA